MTKTHALQGIGIALLVGTVIGASAAGYVAVTVANRYRNPRSIASSARGRHARP